MLDDGSVVVVSAGRAVRTAPDGTRTTSGGSSSLFSVSAAPGDRLLVQRTVTGRRPEEALAAALDARTLAVVEELPAVPTTRPAALVPDGVAVVDDGTGVVDRTADPSTRRAGLAVLAAGAVVGLLVVVRSRRRRA